MIEIANDRDLREFLRRRQAALFFHATWSQYAVISKLMIEFVESKSIMGKRDIGFFWGEFEGDRVPLAKTVVALGVPDEAFLGNGSLSFFRQGEHVQTMRSVIGEGAWAVWKNIDTWFG